MQLLTTVTGMSHSETQYLNNFKSNLKQSNNAIKQWPVYIPIHSVLTYSWVAWYTKFGWSPMKTYFY